MLSSLRKERLPKSVNNLLGDAHVAKIESVEHMPSFVGLVIAGKLSAMRSLGLDDFAFMRAERERALLIDDIGACERIRNTPIPFVLAITIRRFLFLFILLLPFALVDRLGWYTPLVTLLVAYPLFALDEIGAELQNPFSPRNLSHLPLTAVCSTIEGNLLEIAAQSESIS
jgi:putative membrane protein